jgi:hypothetical protein
MFSNPRELWEEYRRLYDQGLSDSEIAKITDSQAGAVRYWRRNQEPPLLTHRDLKRQELAQQYAFYYNQGLSDAKIASKLGVTPQSVEFWRRGQAPPLPKHEKPDDRSRRHPKRFKYWFDLRQDILFYGLTLRQASDKWGITYGKIRAHLKKHPRIKQAYEDREWSSEQHSIQWVPRICLYTHEVIEDLYGVIRIHPLGTDIHRRALIHKAECRRCKMFEKETKSRARAPYRFECPPIKQLAQASLVGSAELTEHLLLCSQCFIELETINSLSLSRVNELIEIEFNHYSVLATEKLNITWADFLSEEEMISIRNILAHTFMEDIFPEEYPYRISTFLSWVLFRRRIHDMGLNRDFDEDLF